jgi:hypothetical protein
MVDVGISRGEACGDGGEFEIRTGDCDMGFEARENRIGMVATIGLLLFRGKKRGPELGVSGETERSLCRNHADDGVGLAVETDGFAYGVGIGGEIFAPEFVAEDDGAIAGLHVGGSEYPAVEGTEAEEREELFRDVGGFDSLRLGVAGGGEFFGGVAMDGDGGERSGGAADVGNVRKRQAEIGKIEEGAACGDVDEFVGIREWERTEEDGIDDREDGGVGADAESESEDGDNCKGRRFFQEAEGETGVVKEGFYDGEGLLFADALFGLFEAAEFEEGLAAGFLGPEALTEMVVDVELQVVRKFGVEVAVAFKNVEQAEEC